MVVDKQKILYDKIDEDIRDIIREINEIKFCATVACCQGHPTEMCEVANDRHFKYAADFYIVFEVYDEAAFLKFMEYLQKGFYKAVNWWMNISKQFYFDPVPGYTPVPNSVWRLSVAPAANSPVKIERILEKTRKWLKEKVMEFRRDYYGSGTI